jgi:N-acetylneuraminate synthase
MFTDDIDIQYINNNSVKICLDVCHLIMAANYHSVNWREWYNTLIKNTGHLHIADAKGIDTEGLPLGQGMICSGDFNALLEPDCLKILEVWQGHLNQGQGFIRDLNTLFG